jgi:hypothetical protein
MCPNIRCDVIKNFWVRTKHPLKQITQVLSNQQENLLSLINLLLAHFYLSTTLSNHGLIRLKKFISQSSRNMCD